MPSRSRSPRPAVLRELGVDFAQGSAIERPHRMVPAGAPAARAGRRRATG
ncbi:hypothetical protein L083_5304 [Actinoplanes sp. N902-109]|nr:hypothetical protein L083_5304 [Actinoplanes sp. N902-109]